VILAESNILSASDFIFQDHTGEKEEQNKTLEEMEKEMIEQTLDQQNWNFTAAADQLGITRQTLYNKIKRYDL
jgi:transcriptional regulator of acetoin/glycerol metabolism